MIEKRFYNDIQVNEKEIASLFVSGFCFSIFAMFNKIIFPGKLDIVIIQIGIHI